MERHSLEDSWKPRDRNSYRLLMGAVMLTLILGAGLGVLLMQPAPVRLAGWTLIGPNNRQPIVLSGTTIRMAGSRPGSWLTFTSTLQNFGPQWKPSPKLQVLSPRIYHYGFFTLIQQ